MDKKHLGLRFVYHIYLSRKIKYALFDNHKTKPIEQFPHSLIDLLFSQETENFIQQEISECNKKGYYILSYLNDAYPEKIRPLTHMPPCLYIEGTMPELHRCIAMVGSRKASPYGASTAFSFAKNLASQGLVIVSGLALGIDMYAHQGALEGKGLTIGVLGCSLDFSYPKSNSALRKKIIQNGAVISEFPLKTPPAPYLFPARNRIISALSDKVVVVEAAQKSGALITVDFALEHGKEIFAVPGNITNPMTKGTHQLIKNGAQLMDSIEDILDPLEMKLFWETACRSSEASIQEHATGSALMELLKSEPLTIPEILEKCPFSPEEILRTITLLEMEEQVESIAGKYTLKA